MVSVNKTNIVNIDLANGNIHRAFLNYSIGKTDSAADWFGVRVFRNGAPVSLTGVSVQGFFRDPNGNNIAITSGNQISGNEAYVVLPQACYNYDGQFTLAIKLVGGGVTGTMRIVDGIINNTNTSGAVAPTETVPTYQEILAVYDEMVSLLDNAETDFYGISYFAAFVEGYQRKITVVTDASNNMIVDFPASVIIMFRSPENGRITSFLTDAPSPATVTVPPDYYLVYKMDTETFYVGNSSDLQNDRDNLVVMLFNRNGKAVGQWAYKQAMNGIPQSVEDISLAVGSEYGQDDYITDSLIRIPAGKSFIISGTASAVSQIYISGKNMCTASAATSTGYGVVFAVCPMPPGTYILTAKGTPGDVYYTDSTYMPVSYITVDANGDLRTYLDISTAVPKGGRLLANAQDNSGTLSYAQVEYGGISTAYEASNVEEKSGIIVGRAVPAESAERFLVADNCTAITGCYVYNKAEYLYDNVRKINLNTTPNELGAFKFGTGEEDPDSNVIRTGFIPVESSTLYQIYSNYDDYRDVYYVFEYAANKSFIKYTGNASERYFTGLTTSATTKYIRIRTATPDANYSKRDIDKLIFMVEQGEKKSFLCTEYKFDQLEIHESQIRYENAYPSYYDTHLAGKISSVNAINDGAGIIDSFVFMTDLHYYPNEPKPVCVPLIQNVLRYSSARYLAYGGDTITNHTKQEAIDLQVRFNDYFLQYEMYQCVGNHEQNNPGDDHPERQLSNFMVEKLCTARYEPWMADSYKYNYRIDNSHRKLSYIFMGCEHDASVPAANLSWFCKTLESIPEGYSVCVISHTGLGRTTYDYPLTGTKTMTEALAALKVKGTYTYSGVTYDYSQTDNDVIAIISGHSHWDGYAISDGILITATTCESMRGEEGGLTRTAGTITETAFDVVSIDAANRKLYMTRIGAGSDRVFDY